MNRETYLARLRAAKDQYQEPILALLRAHRDELVREGFICDEPQDTSGDDYEWCFLARKGKGQFDVKVTLAEECEYDNADGSGITFRWDMVEFDGRIVGEFAPHNYTPQVWVSIDDPKAIKERFQEFVRIANANFSGVLT